MDELFDRRRCAQRTAEVNGSRLLRKAEISAFIESEKRARRQRLRMDADEALEGITRHARADIRKLFKNGRLLPTNAKLLVTVSHPRASAH
jgi:phage terminase small subunit